MSDAYRGNLIDITPKTKLLGFYKGTVVDTNDPLQRGRVRIRVFGIHTQLIEKKIVEGIPDEELPWAEQAAPSMGGTSGNGFFGAPTRGSIVWLFFANGDPLYPVYFGVLFGATVIIKGEGALSGSNSAQPDSSNPAQSAEGNGETGNPDKLIPTKEFENANGKCEAAQKLGVDPCSLQAIAMQESKDSNNTMLGLWEGTHFEAALKKAGKTKTEIAQIKRDNPDLFTRDYKGAYSRQEEKFNRALKASGGNLECVLPAYSFGKYQVLGDFRDLGVSAQDFYNTAMDPNKAESLFMLEARMKGSAFTNAMKDPPNFEQMATSYNGKYWRKYNPNYANNLRTFYNACKKSNKLACNTSSSSSEPSGPQETSINVRII